VAVEAGHESLVGTGAQRAIQEIDGGGLLEDESAADRAADIDQQADLEREIGLTAKRENGFRNFVIVENGEVALSSVLTKWPCLSVAVKRR